MEENCGENDECLTLNTPYRLKGKLGGRRTLLRFTLFIRGYDSINYRTLFISNYSANCSKGRKFVQS